MEEAPDAVELLEESKRVFVVSSGPFVVELLEIVALPPKAPEESKPGTVTPKEPFKFPPSTLGFVVRSESGPKMECFENG